MGLESTTARDTAVFFLPSRESGVRRAKTLLNNKDTLKMELLATPIRGLELKIQRSFLEPCIRKALEDVKHFGVNLQPTFYLSDEYGCMEGTTNIGLGFWDADRLLREILRETKDIYRDEGTILRLIKHEIGHAFCYGFKLYRLKEFRTTFCVEGHFFNTYPDNDRYRWDPWSMNYVNPEGDFYAQKHPDDDFAETFATITDPAESWKVHYKGRKGVMIKLKFVRDAIRTFGRKKPLVTNGRKSLDITAGEMDETVGEFFKVSPNRYAAGADGYMDPELKSIFKVRVGARRKALLSWQLLYRYRKFIEKTVASQSRCRDRRVIADIIAKIRSRLKTLKLVYVQEEEDKTLAMLTSLILLKTVCFNQFGTFKLMTRKS